MENKIIFDGKELKWDYKICPCLECPIYIENGNRLPEGRGKDDKCFTSRCTYNHDNLTAIANDMFFIMNNYHCDECNKWFHKEDFLEPICPFCGLDLF